MPVQNVKTRLDAWREAERHRDTLAPGSPARREAEEEVETAEKVFHAELAQASVRYAEAAFQDRDHGWSTESDRRASPAVD